MWCIFESKIEVPYKYIEDDRENPRDNNYNIVLQPTGELELEDTALARYCRNGTSIDPPLRTIQALDIALKYGAAQRFVWKFQIYFALLSSWIL